MEIGSEFWKFDGNLIKDNSKFWNLGKDTKFVLSGRTAIFYVLKNILKHKKIRKVYMPSYSCYSMIQAFKDLEIEVEYYDVYFNEILKYNIDLENDSDIFFAMNYFGYSDTNMESYIKNFYNKFVIEVGITQKNQRVKFSGDSEKSQSAHQHTISIKQISQVKDSPL